MTQLGLWLQGSLETRRNFKLRHHFAAVLECRRVDAKTLPSRPGEVIGAHPESDATLFQGVLTPRGRKPNALLLASACASV